MQEITKSVSEFLRCINQTIAKFNPCEIGSFPNNDYCYSLSVSEIKRVKRTGSCSVVGLGLMLECRATLSKESAELRAVELAVAAMDIVDSNSFGCTALPPKELAALPLGSSEYFNEWAVTWEQDVTVDKFLLDFIDMHNSNKTLNSNNDIYKGEVKKIDHA